MSLPPLLLPKAITHHIDALQDDQDLVFSVQEYSFIALKHAGKLYLYRNQCPHQNKRLGTEHCLDDSASLIECQHHAAQFLPHTGRCISGPCQDMTLTAYVMKQDQSETFLIEAT
ncbi:Rieske (2Fe-2S) protein [Marinomonas ostreistagni]|uniref:Rieske (2Fe-2S) protein n=1 Tax=Marinomonas ostreistagni TaxID=359209 RepID=UPI0019505D28|nr:Rieske 2Fe-2S domain-containing protein [Marinomonas ostreistagni]MBM6551625.1 Rieske 2Fe-2S domain-containing protein [Marinomonas ostreistagni]